jgi:hypothetical protein
MHTNPQNKKPTEGGNPTAGQHTNNAENTPRLATMASDWHPMGCGYFLEFRTSDEGLQANWSPRIPRPMEMRKILNSGKYLIAREAFLQALSARMGVAVVCVEM